MTMNSGSEPAIRFAKLLKALPSWELGISEVPHAHQRDGGVNTRIEVVKRKAYGYRETECFFLKSKNAFPEER